MSEPAGRTELERLGGAVRQLYILHRRLHEERATGARSRYRPGPYWDGGADRAGRRLRDGAIWPRIARRVVALGADLAEYVAAQFIDNQLPPEPSMLLGDAAAARWELVRTTAARTQAIRLEAEQNHFAMAVAARQSLLGRGPADAARGVLRDRTAPLSPLYRYCVAARTGEDEIAAAYRDAALAQLLAGRAGYVEGWREFLPAELSEEAKALVATIQDEATR